MSNETGNPKDHLDPTPRDPAEARVVEVTETRAKGALFRYRVMAFITGSMLLLLTAEMIMKYGFNNGESVIGIWVAIVHGWIYVVYLFTVLHLWSFMRWDFGRMALLVVAGLIPVLSFIMEPKARKWFNEDLPSRIGMSLALWRATSKES